MIFLIGFIYFQTSIKSYFVHFVKHTGVPSDVSPQWLSERRLSQYGAGAPMRALIETVQSKWDFCEPEMFSKEQNKWVRYG